MRGQGWIRAIASYRPRLVSDNTAVWVRLRDVTSNVVTTSGKVLAFPLILAGVSVAQVGLVL